MNLNPDPTKQTEEIIFSIKPTKAAYSFLTYSNVK